MLIFIGLFQVFYSSLCKTSRSKIVDTIIPMRNFIHFYLLLSPVQKVRQSLTDTNFGLHSKNKTKFVHYFMACELNGKEKRNCVMCIQTERLLAKHKVLGTSVVYIHFSPSSSISLSPFPLTQTIVLPSSFLFVYFELRSYSPECRLPRAIAMSQI